MTGLDLPSLLTPVPGPLSRARVDVLARHECPAVTARRSRRAGLLGAADDDPIVWDAAVGSNVRDVDGNVFVDLTSGFGVALVGHRHPAVVEAVTRQAVRLPHAMGDAFPDERRIELLEKLARAAPPPLTVALLGLSGSDAIDAAVKTAVLATGRTGIITFGGAYHGLALGVLGLQSYKQEFTAPFRSLTHPHVAHLPYGCAMAELLEVLAGGWVGLVMVEPILGRGGVREPPPGWLSDVAALSRAHGALVCFDEILTGMGRTGVPFAGPARGVVPDLMCVGKALGGGFPISACLGSAETMSHWGASTGEAIHTQTFLGHPVGCAAALAVLELLESGLADAVARRGESLAAGLDAWPVRGRGLLRAVQLQPGTALQVSRGLLRRGFLALPADDSSLQLTPPVSLSDDQMAAFIDALRMEMT
jgi:4-aminobutyrate aminotransferase-like enzyme